MKKRKAIRIATSIAFSVVISATLWVCAGCGPTLAEKRERDEELEDSYRQTFVIPCWHEIEVHPVDGIEKGITGGRYRMEAYIVLYADKSREVIEKKYVFERCHTDYSPFPDIEERPTIFAGLESKGRHEKIFADVPDDMGELPPELKGFLGTDCEDRVGDKGYAIVVHYRIDTEHSYLKGRTMRYVEIHLKESAKLDL